VEDGLHVIDDVWYIICLGRVKSVIRKAAKVGGMRISVKGKIVDRRSLRLAKEILGVKSRYDEDYSSERNKTPEDFPGGFKVAAEEDGNSEPSGGRGKAREEVTNGMLDGAETVNTLDDLERNALIQAVSSLVNPRWKPKMDDEKYLELAEELSEAYGTGIPKHETVGNYLKKNFPNDPLWAKKMKSKASEDLDRMIRLASGMSEAREREIHRRIVEREELDRIWAGASPSWSTGGQVGKVDDVELSDQEGFCYLRLFINPGEALKEAGPNPRIDELAEAYNGEILDPYAHIYPAGMIGRNRLMHVEYLLHEGIWPGPPLRELLEGLHPELASRVQIGARHGPCTTIDCDEHKRTKSGRTRKGKVCRGGHRKYEHMDKTECHMCVPDVDPYDKDQADFYIVGPGSLVMPAMPRSADVETVLKPMFAALKHAPCVDPTCPQHVNKMNLCWSGTPSFEEGMCHLCLQSPIAKLCRLSLDGLVYSSRCGRPWWSDGTSKCGAILAAGLSLHEGGLPSGSAVSFSLAESRRLVGCNLCGEDTGITIKYCKVEISVGPHKFLTGEEICSLCIGKALRHSDYPKDWSLEVIDGKSDPARFFPMWHCGDVRGQGKYVASFLGEGISLRRNLLRATNEGSEYLPIDLTPTHLYHVRPSDDGYPMMAAFRDDGASSSMSSSVPIVIDTSAFGNLYYGGAVDPFSTYVICDAVVQEAIRVLPSQPLRLSSFIYFLKYQETVYFNSSGRGDSSILSVASDFNYAILSFDADMNTEALSRKVPVITSVSTIGQPRRASSSWIEQMGPNKLDVVDGRLAVILVEQEEASIRNFFGIKEKTIDPDLTAIPRLERIPGMPAALRDEPFLDVSGRAQGLRRLAQCAPCDLNEVYNWASLPYPRCKGSEGLSGSLDRLEAFEAQNLVPPPGFRAERVDSLFPTHDLSDLEVRPECLSRGMMSEKSLGFFRPNWNGKEKYLKAKTGPADEKPWDTVEIDLGTFAKIEEVSAKRFEYNDERLLSCSPLKRALVEEGAKRAPDEMPHLLKFSRLCNHLLNLMKGKAYMESSGKFVRFISQMKPKKVASDNLCYVSDFGFKNMGVIVYEVPGRFDESCHTHFRFFFITKSQTYEGFNPFHTRDLPDGNYLLVSRCYSFPATKFVHLSNLYQNSMGLRTLNLDPGKYTFWYFYNFFRGTRARKDISLIKFATTVALSDYNTMPNLMDKYLKGIRRTPLERLSLRIWIDAITEILDNRGLDHTTFRGVSYLGKTENLMDYVDLGNTHVMSSVVGETRHHLMSESYKDLRDAARDLPNIWENPVDFPAGGSKTWSPRFLKHGLMAHFQREDLGENWYENKYDMSRLLSDLDGDRDRFFSGPKSSYSWKNPSAYTNSIAHALLVEDVISAGGNDNVMDIINFCIRETRKIGYSLAFQGIKPQHDANARAIVIQTNMAKTLNFVHQTVFRAFNVSSPTELTSKPVIDQQNIVQQVSSKGSSLLINDDMGKWSGSDFKEKFRFLVVVMEQMGVLDHEVTELLLATMELSDQIRIAIPAKFCLKDGVKRVWRRNELYNMNECMDSERDDPSLKNPWSERVNRGSDGVELKDTNNLTLDPRTGQPTGQHEWFAVVVMSNGWMQGLFHSASSFTHDIQCHLFREMVFVMHVVVAVFYLVHSDDKNVTVRSDDPLSELQCEELLNCNSNLPRLAGLTQSATKFSAIRCHQGGDFECIKPWAFSEFLGSVTKGGLAYSSNARQWGVMNSCTHDDPAQNVLALISSHINLINCGADPCVAEISLMSCLAELERRFGLRYRTAREESSGVNTGLDPELLINFLGYPCVSLLEFRNFGTAADKVWKLMKSEGRACGQLVDLPSFATKRQLRKKLHLEIVRLKETHQRYEDRIWGVAYTLDNIEGRTIMSEAGLGILAMGIGKNAARWKYLGELVDVKTLMLKAKAQNNAGRKLDNRMAINLTSENIAELGSCFRNPEVCLSEPQKRFFGYGDLFCRSLDITADFTILKTILEHGGYVNPLWSKNFVSINRQFVSFCNLYSVNSVESFINHRGLWEMHKMHNSGRHTISNVFQGKWSFLHAGIEIKLEKGSPVDHSILPYISRNTLESLTNNPKTLFLKVQDQVNLVAAELLTQKKVTSMDLTRRVKELGRSHPCEPGVRIRGVRSTAYAIISSCLGTEFQLKRSSLMFLDDGPEGMVYAHVLGDIVVNHILVSDAGKFWSLQTELFTTRALAEERWTNFTESDEPFYYDTLSSAWGQRSSIMSLGVIGDLAIARHSNYQKGVEVMFIEEDLPGKFDGRNVFGLYEKTTTLGHRILASPLTSHDVRPGPNLWEYRSEITAAVESTGLDSCDGVHCPDHLHFCRGINMFVKPRPSKDSYYDVAHMIMNYSEMDRSEAMDYEQNCRNLIRECSPITARPVAVLDTLCVWFGSESMLSVTQAIMAMPEGRELEYIDTVSKRVYYRDSAEGPLKSVSSQEGFYWNAVKVSRTQCDFEEWSVKGELVWQPHEFRWLDSLTGGQKLPLETVSGELDRVKKFLIDGYLDLEEPCGVDWRSASAESITTLVEQEAVDDDDKLYDLIQAAGVWQVSNLVTVGLDQIPLPKLKKRRKTFQAWTGHDQLNSTFLSICSQSESILHNLPFLNLFRKVVGLRPGGVVTNSDLADIGAYEEMAMALLIGVKTLSVVETVIIHKEKESYARWKVPGLLGFSWTKERTLPSILFDLEDWSAEIDEAVKRLRVARVTRRFIDPRSNHLACSVLKSVRLAPAMVSEWGVVLVPLSPAVRQGGILDSVSIRRRYLASLDQTNHLAEALGAPFNLDLAPSFYDSLLMETDSREDVIAQIRAGFHWTDEASKDILSSCWVDKLPNHQKDYTPKSIVDYLSPLGIRLSEPSHFLRPLRNKSYLYNPAEGVRQKLGMMASVHFDGSEEQERARNTLAFLNLSEETGSKGEEMKRLQASCSLVPNRPPGFGKKDFSFVVNPSPTVRRRLTEI